MNKKGVLLVNLGTPLSPKPSDVYRYLIEFLTDPKVVDTNWLKRQFLVRGLIVPLRYKSSALSYQKIWTAEGSPLLVHSKQVQKALQELLEDDAIQVELGMRYQQPSIKQALDRFYEEQISEILVLPLFPQYASATTGSIHAEVMRLVKEWWEIPKLTFLDSFATYPPMIRAFSAIVRSYGIDAYDHVLFSFHGLPERQLKKANRFGHCLAHRGCCATLCHKNAACYGAQSFATARAIADSLSLKQDSYSISFQSRLGREPWMQPYTSEIIYDLLKKGKKRLLVVCPAFVCDCLETIFEIGHELKEDFLKAGGEQLQLVEGLNSHPLWLEALRQLVQENLKADCHPNHK